ncbi:MAG: helix-turn-helix domain-containing protein [Thermodesulfobacteriota bacterium]
MKLITVKDLSDSTGIKKSTVYLWASKGIIPHYKVGRLVRFKTEEIEAWLERFRKEAVAPEKKAKKHLRITTGSDVENIVRKAIDDAKGLKV